MSVLLGSGARRGGGLKILQTDHVPSLLSVVRCLGNEAAAPRLTCTPFILAGGPYAGASAHHATPRLPRLTRAIPTRVQIIIMSRISRRKVIRKGTPNRVQPGSHRGVPSGNVAVLARYTQGRLQKGIETTASPRNTYVNPQSLFQKGCLLIPEIVQGSSKKGTCQGDTTSRNS